ncbi:MFS general substrate transporter [Lactarius akahatsu]|uniref:MFS general substrate transporter n=1 Tax=Lactarius akahatsu TaxID=416441 RepID=A0AAD4Q996_9AGAM|nr:MFS general substrate transporter [Lactarius akahatsu]
MSAHTGTKEGTRKPACSILVLLYLLSFLIAGMANDLHLTGFRFNIAVAVFFVRTCCLTIGRNILLRVFRPSKWLPSLMLAWGTVTALTCLVKSYQGLVIVRAFLGLAEGGVFPGVTYYVSLWYPRQMLAKRVSFFTSAAAIAGAFSGLLTYGIEHLDGLLTVDSKGQATHFSAAFVWQALADWKTYVHSLNFMCIAITVYAIALFTPTIVFGLGFSAANAQLLSAPPFVCGSILSLVVGIYSDRVNLRGPFVVAGAIVSLIGYIIAYTTSAPGPGYVAAVIAASGSIPLVPISLVWAAGNSGGNMKRGVVLAMVIGLGNLGGICSSFIYYQPPRFHKGHGTVMGCLSTSIVCSCVLMWTYKRLNKEKEEQCVREGINESMKGMYRDHADKSPLFR